MTSFRHFFVTLNTIAPHFLTLPIVPFVCVSWAADNGSNPAGINVRVIILTVAAGHQAAQVTSCSI